MADLRTTAGNGKKTAAKPGKTEAKAEAKTAVKKPAAPSKPAVKKTTARSVKTQVDIRSSVTPEERQRMIAEAAYLRAERRGFSGGDPNDDWLSAEAEIDQILSRT